VTFAPTVQAASVPTVTSISPVSGPLAGGTVVTITGTNLTGTTQVLFGPLSEEESNHYASEVWKFLARPSEYFAKPTEIWGGAEYGAFPVHVFIEERFGGNPVLGQLKQMRNGVAPIAAMNSWLTLRGSSLVSTLYDFRWSTYLLDSQEGFGFRAPYPADWRTWMTDPPRRLPAGSYYLGSATTSGTAQVHATGSQFLEFTKPEGQGYCGASRCL
jgi:hypothetical protein